MKVKKKYLSPKITKRPITLNFFYRKQRGNDVGFEGLMAAYYTCGGTITGACAN